MIPHWPREDEQDDPLVAESNVDAVYVTEDIERPDGSPSIQVIGNEQTEEWLRVDGVSPVDVEEMR